MGSSSPSIAAVYNMALYELLISFFLIDRPLTWIKWAQVVGSYNAEATLYASVVMKQQTRLEIVAGMQLAVTNLLKNFFQKTGCKHITSLFKCLFLKLVISGRKPENIIMFRDGVGEGQFQAVTNFEVAAIFQVLFVGFRSVLMQLSYFYKIIVIYYYYYYYYYYCYYYYYIIWR